MRDLKANLLSDHARRLRICSSWVLAFAVSGALMAVTQPGTGVGPWFQASAIGVVALVRCGRRVWPALLLAEVAESIIHLRSLGPALVAAIVTTAGMLVAAEVLRAMHADLMFRRSRDLALLSVAAVASTAIDGVLGTTLVRWAGFTDGSWSDMATEWSVGQLAAMVSLLPALLILSSTDVPLRHRWGDLRPSRIVDFVVTTLASATWVVLFFRAVRPSAIHFADLGLLTITILPALWLALRVGRLCTLVFGATLQAAAMFSLTTGSAARTIGHAEIASLVLLMMVTGYIGFAVATVVDAERRANRRLAALVDASPMGIVALDAEGRVTEWNRAAAEMFGTSTAEALGAPAPFTAPPGLAQVDAELHRADGTPFAARITSAPVGAAASDTSAGTIGIVEDVTGLLAVERARAEAEARYELVASHTSDAILMVSVPDGALVYASPGLGRLRGITRDEALARPVTDGLTRHSRRVLGRHVEALLARVEEDPSSTPTDLVELDVHHVDGHLVAIEMSLSVVVDERGRATHLVGVGRDVTARRAAEARFRTLFETLPLGIMYQGSDARIVDVNEGACSIMRLDREALVGTRPSDHGWTARTLDGQEIPTSQWPAAIARLTGLPSPPTLMGLAVGGDEIAWLRVTSVPQHDRTGVLTGVVSIIEDVTAEHAAADELLIRGAALAGSLDAVALTDLRGVVVYVNDALVRMWRAASPADVLGVPAIEFWEPSPQLDSLVAALSRFEPWRGELRGRRRDGTTFDAQFAAVAIRDGAGRPSRFMASVIDISDRKRAVEALRDANVRLEDAQRLSQMGSWEHVPARRRFDWSPELCDILERRPHRELTWLPFLDLVHPDDRPKVDESIRVDAKGGFDLEVRLLLGGGRIKHIRALGHLDVDGHGEPIRSTGVVQDITELQLAAQARELAAARDAAEAASLAKSTFLSNMSHEIRNPLNAVLGYSELLLADTTLTAAQRRYVSAIARGGDHVLRMVNEVLEVARIEAGRVVLEPVPFDLDELLGDVRAMFLERAIEKGLDLAVARDPAGPGRLVADAGRLRQVLINLVDNAIKFTSAGSVRVDARMEWAPSALDGAVSLVIDVADTGAGIAEDDLPALFERFEQAGAGKRSGLGTGLGLAISRGLARLMGGDVTVVSRPGSGSVLTTRIVALPTTTTDGRAVPSRIVGLAPADTVPSVLVVDDADDIRDVLREMLQRIGFAVTTAADGAEALEVLDAQQQDVVLMDLHMPRLDGLGAIRAIRAHPQRRETPVLVVSASTFATDRAAAAEAGADAFLAKPVQERSLLQEIERLVGCHYVYEAVAIDATVAVGAVPPSGHVCEQ